MPNLNDTGLNVT